MHEFSWSVCDHLVTNVHLNYYCSPKGEECDKTLLMVIVLPTDE